MRATCECARAPSRRAGPSARLEERVVAVEGADAASSWERHAQLGDTARNVALVFAVVLALFVLLPWWLERRTSANRTSAQPGTSADNALAVTRNMRWIRTIVAALAVLGAAACVTTIVRAGHTGSASVWQDYTNKTDGG